jgi:hypothetical protein
MQSCTNVFFFLIKEGLSLDRLAKLSVLFPRRLLRKHDDMVYAVKSVKNLLYINSKNNYI